VGDDINTLRSNPNLAAKGLAVIDLSSNVSLLIPFEGEVDRAGIKAIAEVGEHGLVSGGASVAEHTAQNVLRFCTRCFPAGTHVSTPNGFKDIQTLRAGDWVLAENPQTGKVEPEPVQAVIQNPDSPLMAVDLSDGSAITVTADHPFWVDAGPTHVTPSWVQAGNLRPQDLLRTVNGNDVHVMGLRWNVGHAIVYTLTVAHDHTFFVGSSGVLVHNSVCIELSKIINPDVAQKGIHIKVNGVELDVLPGYGGKVAFKPHFSSYSNKTVTAAIKAANRALEDSNTIRTLYREAVRATEYLGKSGNPKWAAKSAETAFLAKALRKLMR